MRHQSVYCSLRRYLLTNLSLLFFVIVLEHDQKLLKCQEKP